jgi:lysophospholipase L1-like esterase
MSDDSHVPVTRRLLGYFTLRRAVVHSGIFIYCLVLFLVFDFAYSSLVVGQEKSRASRVANPVYDHGLAANFDGYDVWGEVRYRLITDSLGFKDASPREVPLQSASRRILLIGDSFTEGIGMSFEESFAGRLARAGQERDDKIEFLNAGAVSYSPSIYYRKIKYLLESGLRFDEVVLFSDTSDVKDEATTYFCIDDDPKYRVHCRPSEGSMLPAASPRKQDFFMDHFVVTNRLRVYIKQSIQFWLGNRRKSINTDNSVIGWAIPGFDAGQSYDPLGVQGGITRSLQNMRALSDLLAAKNIPLTIVVYPWAQQIAQGNRESRQVSIWRDFCAGRCKAFIDLYPAFFAAADADKNWYEHLYILGDDHFSAAGNKMMSEELAKRLF